MKKTLFFILIAFIYGKASGQTDELNHKKYWDLRDRYKKYFTCIGKEQGMSIPISTLSESFWAAPNSAPTIYYGDATSSLGYYIAVLASEYYLLKEYGHEAEAQTTLNELYYAIEAVNRLDDNAEIYLSQGSITTAQRNGFYLRDDAGQNYWQNWNNSNNKYLNDNIQYKTVLSDYFHNSTTNSDPLKFNPENEPSQDQHIALMMGFIFVKELVGSITVQPTPQDAPLNLLSEVQGITNRIMERLDEYVELGIEKYFDVVMPGYLPCAHTKKFKSNYTIKNPVDGSIAADDNSYFIFAQAYGINELAKKITGVAFNRDYKFGWDVSGCDLAQPRTFDLDYDQPNTFNFDEYWYKTAGFFTTAPVPGATIPSIIAYGVLSTATSLSLKQVWEGLEDACTADGDYDFGAFTSGPPDPDVNFQMHLNLASTTNTWSRAKVQEVARGMNQEIFLLMYDLFKRIEEKKVIAAGGSISPEVAGSIFNFKGEIKDILDPIDCKGSYIISATDRAAGGWDVGHRWLHSTVSDSDKAKSVNLKSHYHSIDYMLLYNLYHIAYGIEGQRIYDNTNQSTTTTKFPLPDYTSEVTCPCTDITLNLTQPLEVVKEIIPRFNHYKDFGLELSEYVNTNWQIQTAQGKLKNKNTILTICNNSTLAIQNIGQLQIGENSTNVGGLMVVKRGSSLELRDGQLIIENSGKVIIEEGATLKIYAGAIIQLNGENAVLEIRGKLDILAGATFQTSGTGHVLFNIQNADPSIAPFNIAGTSTSQMLFESTTNPKPLKFIVANGTTLNPQQSLQMFKIDGVKGIIGQNAEIFLGSEFQIQNSLIENSGGNGFTFTTLNFTPIIHHNEFVGGNRALTFIGKDNGRDIKIRYNTFQSVVNTIVMYDHSAHIAGNSFIDNCGGVFAGATLNYLVPPTQGGLYKGRLRMELNRFENSSALELHGAYYPSVIYGGNVAHYTPTGSNPTRTDWTIATEKAHSTLKCNWFENQGEAVYHGMSGNLNMSTQRQSYYALGSGGAYVTGGNNFFKTNLRSVVINSQNSRDPFSFATYDINQGQNSFTAIPSNSRTSLIVDRRWNIQSMNYTLNSSGNMEINGNFWTPLLSTSNYSAGFPSDVIEKNYSISNHFNIYEFQSPDFVVGTNTTASTTCPISVWGDAISDPANFNPVSVVAFGFNSGSPEPIKVYFDRPFGLSDEGFDYPPTTVTSGTYTGQGFGTAFHNALTGTTVQTTDENNNTYYVPNPTGLLNMANLLISTANHSTTDEVEIYSFGYKTYLQCLSRAAALDVFEGSTPAEDAQISAALAVFNAIESNNQQFEVSMPERYYQTRFTVGIDKLHLYRLFDRYTDAQNVLAGLASFAQTKEMSTVDYLSCHVENERKLFANEISWVEYRNNLNNCGMLYGSETLISSTDTIGWGDTSQTSGGSSSTPSLVYTIAPNPATAQTSVIIDMNIDATVTITVFNKFGQQVVTTQNLGTLLTGSQTTATVTLSGLPADTYNMVVYADGVPYVQHFIKLTE